MQRYDDWVIPSLLGLRVACSHSITPSAPPSRLPISVVMRYFSSGCTACSFACRFGDQFLFRSALPSYIKCSKLFFKNSSLLHYFLPLVYIHTNNVHTDCSACWHHQHSVVSITHILAKKNLTAPSPILNWKSHEAYLFGTCPDTGYIPFGYSILSFHFSSNFMSRFLSFWRLLFST